MERLIPDCIAAYPFSAVGGRSTVTRDRHFCRALVEPPARLVAALVKAGAAARPMERQAAKAPVIHRLEVGRAESQARVELARRRHESEQVGYVRNLTVRQANVERALRVGSLERIIPGARFRSRLIDLLDSHARMPRGC